LENALVAGRSLSCDRYIQGSIRTQPGCFITGQARESPRLWRLPRDAPSASSTSGSFSVRSRISEPICPTSRAERLSGGHINSPSIT
jgi:hypothetical protein